MKFRSKFNKKIYTYCVLTLLLGSAPLTAAQRPDREALAEYIGYIKQIKSVESQCADYLVAKKLAELSCSKSARAKEAAESAHTGKRRTAKSLTCLMAATAEHTRAEISLDKIIDRHNDETDFPRCCIAMMILHGQIKKDEYGNDIKNDQCDETAARLLRESIRLPISKYNLAELILQKGTNVDEKGNEIDLHEMVDGKESITPRPERRNEIAARLYRESKEDPQSLSNLAFMIIDGTTNFDEYGNRITSPNQQNEIAARLFRESKEDPRSSYNLAVMIRIGTTDYDENGIRIPSTQRDEVVARLYRESKEDPRSSYNLAVMIGNETTNLDENGIRITSAQRSEVVARLYRKSKEFPQSSYNLAVMIRNGTTDYDENGIRITSAQRDEVEARLYRKSKEFPNSLYNLVGMVVSDMTNRDENERLLSTNTEKLDAINRMLRQYPLSEKYYVLSRAQYKYKDHTVENLRSIKENLERALGGGYSEVLPFYYFIENQLKKLEEPTRELAVSAGGGAGGASGGATGGAVLVTMCLSPSDTPESHEDDGSDEYASDDDEDLLPLGDVPPISAGGGGKMPAGAGPTESSSPRLEPTTTEFQATQKERTRAWREQAKTKRQAAQAQFKKDVEKAGDGHIDLKMHAHTHQVSAFKESWEVAAIKGRVRLAALGFEPRIKCLIEDINRRGSRGKPETLIADLAGWMSRRITEKHRLVYCVTEDGQLIIKECGGHYRGK